MTENRTRERRPPGTKVRNATADEAEKLASLHVTTWQQAYAELLPDDYLLSLTPAQRLPMWQQLLNSPERVAIFVADNEGDLIGFSCGGISSDEDAGPSTGEMWSIYLLREFWGMGIGSDLHDALLEELRRREFEEATLWVMESNERTRHWYERQGWATDGSQKSDELWGAAISEIRYRRPLMAMIMQEEGGTDAVRGIRAPDCAMDIRFERMEEGDLPVLAEWLNRAHVIEWWGDGSSLKAVREKYLPRLNNGSPVVPYIAYLDDVAIGYIQSHVVEGSGVVRGLDMFLADPDRLNQGLGAQMVAQFTKLLFQDPSVTKVQADPAPANTRAIRCYEKAGFKRTGIIVTPDGEALLMIMEFHETSPG